MRDVLEKFLGLHSHLHGGFWRLQQRSQCAAHSCPQRCLHHIITLNISTRDPMLLPSQHCC